MSADASTKSAAAAAAADCSARTGDGWMTLTADSNGDVMSLSSALKAAAERYACACVVYSRRIFGTAGGDSAVGNSAK